MADKIKGITIEIGSDTVGLQKALKDINSQSKKLQSELSSVERLLKFNPGNAELLTQKQKLLTDQITQTETKLNALKQAQSEINTMFQKGDIGEEEYRKFQREVIAAQGALDGLKVKLSNVEGEQQNITNSTKQLETLFKATGTSVDNFSNALGTRLTNAIKNGTASSKQLEDAINKIGTAALGTNVDLSKMKQALASVDDGNAITNVKKDLQTLTKEASDTQESVEGLGSELGNLAGALAAGGGIAGTVNTALENADLNTKIDVTFDVPESSKASVKDAINTVTSYGVDAEAALEGVRRQWALNKNASDSANAAVVQGAGAIASTYSGIDFTELIQETNEISQALNISNEDALGLTNALLKIGFPPEQLDIISEYGTQLQMAGYDAKEIQAIMAAGVETGTWNIDNLLDKILSL